MPGQLGNDWLLPTPFSHMILFSISPLPVPVILLSVSIVLLPANLGCIPWASCVIPVPLASLTLGGGRPLPPKSSTLTTCVLHLCFQHTLCLTQLLSHRQKHCLCSLLLGPFLMTASPAARASQYVPWGMKTQDTASHAMVQAAEGLLRQTF